MLLCLIKEVISFISTKQIISGKRPIIYVTELYFLLSTLFSYNEEQVHRVLIYVTIFLNTVFKWDPH